VTLPGGDDWWRRAVFYQVYPRSFQDSNGDGIGDLQGIIDRLDYLNDGTDQSLGIDAIWLSPTFPSPMKDFGYDVSDYCDVAPEFGDLPTMDRLIAECHRRGIRLLLDFVPNHSSDLHPWFIESRSSRDNPKRDWYIWRDPKPDGSLPNNWRAVFGGPAWQFDELTGQYYLHSFLMEQPDLNWRSPQVVAAMHDVLRFWLARGVDGFRIDVLGMILKHPELADNEVNPDWAPGSPFSRYLSRNNRNHPAVLGEFPGAMAVGEVFGTAEELSHFYGDERLDGLHLLFNFHFINEREPVITPWTAEAMRRIVAGAEAGLPKGAQPCYAFGNHDRPRFISRLNHDGHGPERARAAALLLLGLRSSPFIYYGEEIGMVDGDIPDDQLQDPARFRSYGRDPVRTPMQWDASKGRGFSGASPWLPYGSRAINVARESGVPDSLLSLYRHAIRVRKQEPALTGGSYVGLPAPEGVFAFVRSVAGGRSVVVLVNTSAETRDMSFRGATVIAATDRTQEGAAPGGKVTLPPFEAAWVALG
jgi:alpha-glucosidase